MIDLLFGADERKHYRFPSKTGLLDFELDHSIYFPSKETSQVTSCHKEDKSMTKQSDFREF